VRRIGSAVIDFQFSDFRNIGSWLNSRIRHFPRLPFPVRGTIRV
jgi:hypothetical protein